MYSTEFIFAIALTALLLLFAPLIHGFVCHYQGDKAEHAERLAKEKQAAVRGDYLLLETDSVRRKQYLRFPKLLFLTVCPGCLLVSVMAKGAVFQNIMDSPDVSAETGADIVGVSPAATPVLR